LYKKEKVSYLFRSVLLPPFVSDAVGDKPIILRNKQVHGGRPRDVGFENMISALAPLGTSHPSAESVGEERFCPHFPVFISPAEELVFPKPMAVNQL
jgi:hypothetical protein